METYHGYVRTPGDAIKLFEACRLGLLPRVQRRLSEKERKSIRSGSVFVWDEREAGMRRWTDGKSWSASRVSGSFLTYREMEGKRGGGFGGARRGAGKTPESSRNSDEEHEDVEPEGYRYKADGLMKQSFSITTSTGQHLHLISYYYRPQPGQPDLPQPSSDPNLRAIVPAKGMYPESSMGETNQTPALTRAPMQQPYMIAPQHGHGHQPYTYTQPGYAWPLSPAATPPYGHYAPPSYPATVHGLPPPQTQAPPPPTYSHGHYTHATTAAPERTALPPLQASKASPLPPYQGHYVASHPPRMHDSPGQKKLPTAAQAVIGDARLNSGKVKGVHGPLPGLNSVTGGTSSACHAGIATPPTRHVSISPPRSSLSDGSLSRSGTRPSFSALLHPTPNSEPASVKTVSNGSVNSSPRAHGLELTKAEDLRALRMLDRKFCI